MTDLLKCVSEQKQKFWDQVEGATSLMMGFPRLGAHLQPMAPFADRKNGVIWFYTRRSSNLVKSITTGTSAQISLVSNDHDYHASIFGNCSLSTERHDIDKLWSPIIAAWFEGKNDPNLVMIAFSPIQASVWVSDSNVVAFGWEIAKANISDATPDLGETFTLSFVPHSHQKLKFK